LAIANVSLRLPKHLNLNRTSDRRDYKKGVDSDAGRRRRDDTRIQIRKNKREEGLQKKRAMAAAQPDPPAQVGNEAVSAFKPRTAQVTDIPEIMRTIKITADQNTPESNKQMLEAVQGIRKMLSVEKNPPVLDVIEAGAVPVLVGLLQRNDLEKVQFEAAWALTNVASTQYTEEVVTCGAVPDLARLLLSGNADVREQSAWCLGNIAGDNPTLRDVVLSSGALEPLLQNMANPASNTLLNNVVWALSNFFRGKPQPKVEVMSPAVPYLTNFVQNWVKGDAIMDACWALSYMSDGDDDRIATVMQQGVTPHLCRLLGREESSIVTPALRTLGNFVSGNEIHTQAVLDGGIMDQCGLLNHPKKNIRKEFCWLLSNIAAGSPSQIHYLLSFPRVLSTVISLIRNGEWEVRKEANWVICNIATGGSDADIQGLVDLGAIDAICSLLDVADSKITLVILDAIDNILKVGERLGKDYIAFVDECDGLEKIEDLQQHQNIAVYDKAIEVIEKYFGVCEDEGDENVMPSIIGDQFEFGLPTSKQDENMSLGLAQQPLQPFNF